jgi:hypothetical protein
VDGALQGVAARMPETLVPQVCRGGSGGQQSLRGRRPERVERAGTVTAEHLHPGRKSLDRETMGIKFDRDIVIPSESTKRDQVLD